MTSPRYSRQSFLGVHAQEAFERRRIGIVGLGGGGSHIVQQLAHIGFLHYVIYDPDTIEDSNLNRTVGATEANVAAKTPKVEVARKLILGLQPTASVDARPMRWQDEPESLRGCDLLFGCVDTFAERRELEICARRYLIPYIDVGMDVHSGGEEPPVMAGQVILSMPGDPCMFCLGFLTEERLAQEAAQYGAAGPRPQVVWPNGILASTAVGVAIDLLTDWTKTLRGVVYLSYRGNAGTLTPHVRLDYLSSTSCPHYTADQVGEPVFRDL